MKYYRVNNAAENHMGLQYNTGLVEDYRRCGVGFLGGIHFASTDILAFINFGPWIREVTVPDGTEIFRAGYNAREFKAQRVILGERREITLSVVRELVAEGADVNAVNGTPLINATCLRKYGLVKTLLDCGANPLLADAEALRIADKIHHLAIFNLISERCDNGNPRDRVAV